MLDFLTGRTLALLHKYLQSTYIRSSGIFQNLKGSNSSDIKVLLERSKKVNSDSNIYKQKLFKIDNAYRYNLVPGEKFSP